MIEIVALKTFPQFSRDFIRNELSYESLMYMISTIPPYRGIDSNEGNNKSPVRKKDYKNFNQFIFG